MHFTQMRVTGFKSFVEPVEIPIAGGLTGIVGPNGCGKSNVVEALRWVMGENSARRLRGSEMDDVIFAGSAGRPARNLAEVVLLCDNRRRMALAEFNGEDDIEVARRIERGLGSDYRINGRPVRQKDVQLLFADQATGAHSTSIVSQGKIGALIQARPQERRQVLEEAAGVAGLHARRHEAELKLKAAEANLARVGDQLATMEAQLRGLKTQARQSSRYRNLGDVIRKAEAALLLLKITAAAAAQQDAERAHAGAEERVRDLSGLVARASAALAEGAARLPPLRAEEAAASAVVQRLFLERETNEREARQVKEAQESLARRLDEVRGDRDREESLLREAESALAPLEPAIEAALAEQARLAAEAPGLESRAQDARAAGAAQEKIFQESLSAITQAETAAVALETAHAAALQRLEGLRARFAEAASQADAAQNELRAIDLSFPQALVSAAEAGLAEGQAAARQAQESRRRAEDALAAARAAKEAVQTEKTRLEAEAAAIGSFLSSGADGTPLADRLTVEKGYEAALAAALGEGLLAPLEEDARAFWKDLGPVGWFQPGLPAGAEPLLGHVRAPPALKRALGFAGIVDGDAAGERLARELKAGQILVSREGAAWRWDGYTRRKDAETPAAARLAQHSRLTGIRSLLEDLMPRATETGEALRHAGEEAQAAAGAAGAAEAALQQAYDGLHAARGRHAETARERAGAEARRAALAETMKDLQAGAEAAARDVAALDAQKRHAPDFESLRGDLESAKENLLAARARLVEAETAQASHAAGSQAAAERLKAAQESQAVWRARQQAGRRQLQELAARQQALAAEEEKLALRPAEIEATRQELLGKSAAAETARAQASDALLEAEREQAGLDRNAKDAETRLGEAKESRVRAEEQMFRARGVTEEFTHRIREAWHCAPGELREKAGLEEALPPLEEIEQNLARYMRERENMGPVNLRAEIEADELQAAMDRITADKGDLEGAIAKLRQGISALNREARARLEQAFEQVDRNFGDIFTRLFGGGRACLKLIESEDPLEAGLEIYASPPGKRLQALSLLSGGEQALTALALLFAIFLVNPSPICVLDEVDAPLDEANVERFCALLREMADAGRTRFLVITHHRLTMARMDRLFGVTMAEKGVSQIVSVDLKEAIALREPAGATAHGDPADERAA